MKSAKKRGLRISLDKFRGDNITQKNELWQLEAKNQFVKLNFLSYHEALIRNSLYCKPKQFKKYTTLQKLISDVCGVYVLAINNTHILKIIDDSTVFNAILNTHINEMLISYSSSGIRVK